MWLPVAVAGSAGQSVADAAAEVARDNSAVAGSHHQRWEEVAVAVEGRSSASVAGRQRRLTAESEPRERGIKVGVRGCKGTEDRDTFTHVHV